MNITFPLAPDLIISLSLSIVLSQVFLLSLLDLPFSISPVVTGLMLTLLYGRNGWFGPLLQQSGINIVFAFGGAVCWVWVLCVWAGLFMVFPQAACCRGLKQRGWPDSRV